MKSTFPINIKSGWSPNTTICMPYKFYEPFADNNNFVVGDQYLIPMQSVLHVYPSR